MANINIDINSDKTRENIFNFLYKHTDSHYESKIITNLEIVQKFKNSKYVAFAKNKGNKVWLLFCKLNDIYYRVSFPCHYKEKQNTIEIFPLNAQFYKPFYNGTILEATFFKIDDKKIFVVDNVIMLCGKIVNMYERSYNLSEVNVSLRKTRQNSNFEICTAHVYQFDKNELANLYNFVCENPNIEAIVFSPNNSIRNKNYTYYIENDDKNKEKLITTYSVFEMKKTNNPDVYILYSKDDNEEIGNAYIPTKDLSLMCRKWFKSRKETVYVKCKKTGEKWEPYSLDK